MIYTPNCQLPGREFPEGEMILRMKLLILFEPVSSKMLYNIFIATIQDSFAFKHPEVIS